MRLFSTIFYCPPILNLRSFFLISIKEIPENPVQIKSESNSPKMSVQESECSEQIPTSDNQYEIGPTRSVSFFHFQPPSVSNEQITLPQEMQIYLIGALSNRYLKEVGTKLILKFT